MQDIGLSQLAGAMNDVWGILRDCYEPPNSEKAGEKAIQINKKYGSRLVEDLLLVVVNHIELRERNQESELKYLYQRLKREREECE